MLRRYFYATKPATNPPQVAMHSPKGYKIGLSEKKIQNGKELQSSEKEQKQMNVQGKRQLFARRVIKFLSTLIPAYYCSSQLLRHGTFQPKARGPLIAKFKTENFQLLSLGIFPDVGSSALASYPVRCARGCVV